MTGVDPADAAPAFDLWVAVRLTRFGELGVSYSEAAGGPRAPSE